MDAFTALLVAVLMMLLNGGVLGLMHRDMPATLQPAAVSWRVGTLMQAMGCVLLALQNWMPLGLVLPLANALLMLGVGAYWRALRQFYGQADSWLPLLPVALGTLGVYWFSAVTPDLSSRVVVASAAWVALLFGCVLTLRKYGQGERAMSRQVLAWIFGMVALFMLARMLHYGLRSQVDSMLDNRDWMNLATPMIAAIMPVIGTTAFLLLCSQRLTRQWERAASTDYLTGLPNRRTLAAAGEAMILSAGERRDRLAVAVIDIDHFKSINDRFGHDVGDAALKHVAARIDAACRGSGVCGRQGGEEFVALFDHVDAAQAMAAAERLRERVQADRFHADGVELTITVSVGVARLHVDDRRLDDALRRADQALYLAKAGGRNRVQLAS
ncbi:MAG: GGDEF domain-containing protein [Rhodanobacteraceae bacterium]|nr:GGDEF domain-containing protein [Rhodanobacteraceae bacterium]